MNLQYKKFFREKENDLGPNSNLIKRGRVKEAETFALALLTRTHLPSALLVPPGAWQLPEVSLCGGATGAQCQRPDCGRPTCPKSCQPRSWLLSTASGPPFRVAVGQQMSPCPFILATCPQHLQWTRYGIACSVDTW